MLLVFSSTKSVLSWHTYDHYNSFYHDKYLTSLTMNNIDSFFQSSQSVYFTML